MSVQKQWRESHMIRQALRICDDTYGYDDKLKQALAKRYPYP